MSKQLLLILLILLSISLHAQESRVDSLDRVLKSELSDETRLNLLLELAEEIIWDSLATAEIKTEEAFEIAERMNSKLGLADCMRVSGKILFEQSELSRAVERLDSAAVLYDELQMPEKQMEIIYNKAKIERYSNDLSKAYELFEQVMKFKESQGDAKGVITNLTWLAIVSDEMNDHEQAIKLSEQAYTMAAELGEIDLAAMNLNNLGLSYKAMGRADDALRSYENGYKLAQQLGNREYEAVFIENSGVVYSNLGNFSEALRMYFDAIAIYEELNDERSLETLYGNIGLIYKKNGEYEKAITEYKRSIALNTRMKKSLNMLSELQNVGTAFMLLNEYDSALVYLNRARALAIQQNQVCNEGIYGSLGILNLRLGQLDSARILLEKELAFLEQCETMTGFPQAAHALGQVHEELGNDDKAKYYYDLSFSEAKDLGYLESIKDASGSLYAWHKRKGNSTRALEFLEIHQSTKDTLFNQENTRELAWLEADYKMQQVTDSLSYQKAQQARELNAEIQEKRRQKNYILIISLAVLIGLLVFYFFRKKQRELKFQEELNQERTKGFEAVIQAIEEERKRIAKDLHDGIVQQLVGLKLGLQKRFSSMSDPDPEADRIIKVVDDSAKELRELSHKMMPRALSELGLIPALNDMLKNSLGNSSVKYNFEHFGVEPKERFKEKVEISLYRISQELVNNVIKHSDAALVNVQLIRSGKNLILIIEDDGKGIAPKSEKQGIGLMNIRSRLDTIDGKVDYSSSPSGGVLVTVKIPLS